MWALYLLRLIILTICFCSLKILSHWYPQVRIQKFTWDNIKELYTCFTQDRQPARVVWQGSVYFWGTGSDDAASYHIIKEIGESSRHATVSAEAGREGVIRDVGVETRTPAELCRRYVDNTTSPCTALPQLWKLQTQNKEPKQWHMYVINKHATDNPLLIVYPLKW